MKFSIVSECFDEIEKTSSRLAITKLLAELFKAATPNEAACISYMSLGELNPVYVGTQFNIAQKSMIGTIAKLLGKSEATIKQKTKNLGDIGLVAKDYKPRKLENYTVAEVNSKLHKIHDISGTGSQTNKQQNGRASCRERV